MWLNKQATHGRGPNKGAMSVPRTSFQDRHRQTRPVRLPQQGQEERVFGWPVASRSLIGRILSLVHSTWWTLRGTTHTDQNMTEPNRCFHSCQLICYHAQGEWGFIDTPFEFSLWSHAAPSSSGDKTMDAPCASFASLGQLMDSIEQKDIRPGTHTHIFQSTWCPIPLEQTACSITFPLEIDFGRCPQAKNAFQCVDVGDLQLLQKPRKKTPRSFTSAKGGA